MNQPIYAFQDYKDALRAIIAQSDLQRGFHGKLAKAAGCQSSFLSQVLGSHVHLTSDHIAGIADFLGFDEDEHEYFQALLGLARCSAPRLLRTYRRRIAELKAKHEDVASRVKANRLDAGAEELTYYSAWYWVAIHVVCSIPEFRKPASIADRLKLPRSLVEECLKQLETMGLVVRRGQEWETTQHHIHVGKESALVQTHHTNWRLQSAMKAAMRDPDALQYSVVTAVSRMDHQRLKNLVLELIENSRALIGPSREEELIYLGLDCFRL